MVDLSIETIGKLFFKQIRDLSVAGAIGGDC